MPNPKLGLVHFKTIRFYIPLKQLKGRVILLKISFAFVMD